MQTLLITGGAGQVGTSLRQLAWPSDVKAWFPSRAEVDLANQESLNAIFADQPIAAVINCAAFTAVDRCESEPAIAWQVNAYGPAALAAATAARAIPLIHVSTDYVFDGMKISPYVEDDAVGPLCVYGASKELGEQSVRSLNPRHAIVRTSWVVSPYRSNFVKTMLRLAAERDLVRVVDDQIGAPTHADDLAQALATIALRLINDPQAATGTFHFANAGIVSWHGVAEEIFRLGAEAGHKVPRLEAITTAQYPLPARRPANSLLPTAKIKREYAITPRAWQDGLHDISTQLLQS